MPVMPLDSHATLRIAAFQRKPLFDKLPATLARLAHDLRWCDEHGVDVAVFPECYLQGYSSDSKTLARRAISLDDACMMQLLSALATTRVTCLLGLVERRSELLYNSVAVIRQGEILGVYSKSHPNEAAFTAGLDFPVFEVRNWRFGINICNDANFAAPARRLGEQGASLLCYPLNNMLLPATADKWRQKSLENLQQRAIDTGCWVISADVVGQHGEQIAHGCTCLFSPDGQVRLRVAEGQEGVVVADITGKDLCTEYRHARE
ncbi:carbon-nitrogen hydrolase family protein [Undibacterium sp. TJN19]|uniref:carbon-nitrogen hydrolase family protein n=1 Tax=Undibacterium sp. TJN19 TaxID=3413055 RepID=UPI003BEFF04E